MRSDLRRETSVLVDLGRVDVQWHAVHHPPEEVLTRASAVADLVVVGSRGCSRLHELLLGSVTRHVLYHAEGPVVVVRADPATRRPN